ncbi:hypothetical protein A2U01_0011210, partial [Trifolium medium]|nr:hypothetical protein [Trifolium medium]
NYWSNKRLQHPGSAHSEAYVPIGTASESALLLPESDLIASELLISVMSSKSRLSRFPSSWHHHSPQSRNPSPPVFRSPENPSPQFVLMTRSCHAQPRLEALAVN